MDVLVSFMSISTKVRIGIILLIGVPSILGIGVLAASQLNLILLADDFRGVEVQQVVLDKTLFDNASRDGIEFDQITLKGDLLTIKFTYTGGLEIHVFELIGSGDFAESAPIQTTLVLSHDANGDSGEVLVSKELNFDLKPLKEAFLQYYDFYAPPDSLLIQLESYGEITYTL